MSLANDALIAELDRLRATVVEQERVNHQLAILLTNGPSLHQSYFDDAQKTTGASWLYSTNYTIGT